MVLARLLSSIFKFMENNGKAKYDWITLKQEFFNSDIVEVSAFIRHKFGIEMKDNGQVANKTTGWGEDKKEWKRKRIEEIQKQADKELINKLKIGLKDLLMNKRLLFGLDGKYLEILGKLQSSEADKQPTEEERRFFQNYTDKVKDIFQRL